MTVPYALVAVGSMNPVKLAAARELGRYAPFTFSSARVPSGIAPQPFGYEETMRGAVNRAKAALSAVRGGAFGLGLEGGIRDDGDRSWAFACCAIVSPDGRLGRGTTGELELPPSVRSLVIDGLELGHAIDRAFQRSNTKETVGAIGVLTDGRIDRVRFYAQAVHLAYVPFLHPEIYP